MKKASYLSILLATLCLPAFAADVTTKLEGEATCAKCTLKQTDSCQTAVTAVGPDGKKETYFADKNDVAKRFHIEICNDTKKVKAEGTVTESDGKKRIALTRILTLD